MLKDVGYTIVCCVGKPPRPEIVGTGMSIPIAAQTMLALENGSHERFQGEPVGHIMVREDDSTVYLPTDQFFDFHYH